MRPGGPRRVVGLIGYPLRHSISPRFQQAGFDFLRLPVTYQAWETPPERVAEAVERVRADDCLGMNVTVPHKQAVMPLLDEISADAQQIGAVNCVTIANNGRTVGYNTDRIGFKRNFEEGLGRACVEDRTAVLVGAGGAGRAVAFALMDLGAATVSVHDTDTARAAALVADLMLHYGAGRCRLADSLPEAILAAAGVVNATPVGMQGIPGNPVPVVALAAGHWVADVIYTPIETELIKAARAAGARTLTGGGMCVHQAAETFRLFTGVQPDVARMHRTFAAALARRDAATPATVA